MEDLKVQPYKKFMKFWKKKELILKFKKVNLDTINGGYKEPYIKYVGGGAGGFLWGSWNILGIYWWAMKYFSKFLMGHEIFFYVLFL